MIKNFGELLFFTKNRVNFVDEDEQVDMILKEALNYAYTTINKQIKTIQTAYLPIIEGVAVLPEDCLEVIETDPALGSGDKIKGSNIITKYTGSLTVKYTGIIDRLEKDTDVLDIPQQYVLPISTYACGMYYGFKKKTELSSYYMNDYFGMLESFKMEDSTGANGIVSNFYGDLVND